MKVILFGATGMVGQGALLECLDDPRVERVLAVVRKPTGRTNAKLEEVIAKEFADLSAIEARMEGFDACLYCLGVSAAGLDEAVYRHITYDFALAAGRMLARINPRSTFCYVSGAGTDSTERSWQMWARVKGKTENDLLALPFSAYMFRPGFIQPVRGVTSSTDWYRAIYDATGWMYPALSKLFPRSLMTSATLGRALIAACANGAPKRILEPADIIALAPKA